MDKKERDDLDALEAYDTSSVERLLARPAAPAATATAGERLPYCQEYCGFRKVIVLLLPRIKQIPVFGRKLGLFLELVMKLVDPLCQCG